MTSGKARPAAKKQAIKIRDATKEVRVLPHEHPAIISPPSFLWVNRILPSHYIHPGGEISIQN
jgi:hypothetical protein